jgi:hypothetical protein
MDSLFENFFLKIKLSLVKLNNTFSSKKGRRRMRENKKRG